MFDEHYASVSLLVHGDGTNGSSTFTDNSSTPKELTASGAVVTTTTPKFGTGCISIPNTSAYISTPGSAAFALGTGDFTVELWVNVASVSNNPMVLSLLNGSSAGEWQLQITASRTIGWISPTSWSAYSTLTVPSSTWTHIAFSRNSGVLNGYVDGVLFVTISDTTNYNNSTSALYIGKRSGGATNPMLIDNVRVTKGVGRYPAAFSPITTEFGDALPPPTEHATFALIAPVATVASASGGVVAIQCPSPALSSASGALLSLTAPYSTLLSNGHDSTGEQAANLVAPSPTLTITTGANARVTAPIQTLAATGTVTGWSTSDLVAPSPTLSASGTVSGIASATLASPIPNLIGYGGAVCSITITGKATLTATGTTGSIGGAALSCPLFELTASATAQNHGSANLLAPSPRMGASAQAWLIAPSAQLTSIGSAVITATYEAYAVNLGHRNPEATTDEVTRYTNFPFTHVVRYQNSYYGANSTGLYLLEGSTDDGTPIPWAVQTAMTDFKTPNKKTLAAAYFSGRLGPASTISLIEGEHTPSVYSFTTPRGTLAQNHRQKFGKGTKGRYYALSASGTGTCELDGIEPEVHQLTRRI